MKTLALLAIVACSNPPRHAREPDDDRGGAIPATHEERYDYWHFNGSLDADDAIDWIRFDLPAERAQFEIELRSDLPFEGEVYAADGTELAKLPAKINAATLIYVRVARGAKRSTGTYYVKARRGPIPDPPPAKLPECDRENFDASRPECKGKCDFKNPDASEVGHHRRPVRHQAIELDKRRGFERRPAWQIGWLCDVDPLLAGEVGIRDVGVHVGGSAALGARNDVELAAEDLRANLGNARCVDAARQPCRELMAAARAPELFREPRRHRRRIPVWRHDWLVE
jgi:hypothetical protein